MSRRRSSASLPQASRPAPTKRRRWGWSNTFVVLVAVLGAGVLAYPPAAAWFSDWSHLTAVDGYVQQTSAMPNDDLNELLEAAYAYNENLPSGPLRDPYAVGVDGARTDAEDGTAAYFNALKMPGTEVMARVQIPAIDVDLPVLHGTDDRTLSRGVGHLYGSSLPVGGSGSHSVLTGHSGYVGSTLFDNLKELVVDDVIVVSVAGEELFYKVDRITTVLPSETDELRQETGRDLITLVTCTPTGVNTHRLLVRAERIDVPSEELRSEVLADSSGGPGFPWWALTLIGVPLVAFVIVRPSKPRKSVEPSEGGRAQ